MRNVNCVCFLSGVLGVFTVLALSVALGSQSMVCLCFKVGTALCQHLSRGNLTSIASALFFCIVCIL